MSRGKRRGPRPDAGATPAPAAPPDGSRMMDAGRRAWAIDLALMLGAFAAITIVAQLAGAANLGTALTFGMIAFALVALFVLMRR